MSLLKRLVHHPRPVILFYIVFAVAMMPGLRRLGMDNSSHAFFSENAVARAQYEAFQRDFGGGETVRIAARGPGLWTKDGLTWLGNIEEHAASIPGVEAAVGLVAHHRWLLLEWPPPSPAAFQASVLADSLDRGAGWVSADGEVAAVLVVFSDLAPADMRRALQRLGEIICTPPAGVQARISGLPVYQFTMDHSLIKMVAVFLPLLALVTSGWIFFIYRRFRETFLLLFFVFICEIFLFGIMGYAGVRLNLVSSIIPLLIFVISSATAVHIFIRFRGLVQQGMKPTTAALTTYRSKGRPVLWTGLTTLVAFGSLMAGNIAPVRTIGLWSAVGIAIMTILLFTLFPALLAGSWITGSSAPVRPFETLARRLGQFWADWAIRHRTLIIFSTAFAAVASILGIFQLQVEDNLAFYFSSAHPVRVELEELERHGLGTYAAELIISRANKESVGTNGEETSFLNPGDQELLAELSEGLRADPQLLGAVSSGDLVEATIQAVLVEGEVNDNIRWLALGLLQSAPDGRRILHALMTPDAKKARVTLLLPMLSFNRAEPLFEKMKDQALRLFPDAKTWITGEYPLILLAQKRLLQGLIVSFSMTVCCVALAFFLLLRSLRLAFFALVPNLWPIGLVIGGMGWLRIPLDSASVMTGSLVLGLAVDDTFHTLGHYLRLVRRCGAARAVEATLRRNAPAHILTTVILTVGFFACSFSELLPFSRMGALSAVAILFALLGDMVLVPALFCRGGRDRTGLIRRPGGPDGRGGIH
jgi:predicted RND superfamily exporter protein